MDYHLLVVRGRSTAESIKLADGVTTVGRHDDCQLRIKSSQVSRRHCEIFEKKGLLMVKDLGSSNGTFVNGKRIEEQRVLEPGDELTIGQVKLRVAKVGQAPPPPRKKPAAKKPGDTDIMGALGIAEPGGDELDIEYDGEPVMLEEAPGEDVTVLEPAPEAKSKSGPKPAPAPEPEPEVEPEPDAGLADDAINDFLLDLKLDDDE